MVPEVMFFSSSLVPSCKSRRLGCRSRFLVMTASWQLRTPQEKQDANQDRHHQMKKGISLTSELYEPQSSHGIDDGSPANPTWQHACGEQSPSIGGSGYKGKDRVEHE
jgi:hypothetical protein